MKTLRLTLCALAAAAFLVGERSFAVDGAVPERVKVSEFGYDAADSTAFLQAAIDSGAPVVVVDKQAGPWITTTLRLRDNLELVLEEDVELLAKADEFKGLNDCLLVADKTKNLTIRGEGKGAALRMRKRDYWAEPYRKSEWRHGISLRSAENVHIENLQIAETGGDGIYVSTNNTVKTPCRNVTIRGVDCVENNRQGISVISVDGLVIEDCVLRDTNGTAPAAGIDFEPNQAWEQISRVEMRRVVCMHNAGDGILFYLGNLKNQGHELSVLIEDCDVVRNQRKGFDFMAPMGEGSVHDGEIVLRDSRIVGNQFGVYVSSKWASGAPMTLENVTVETAAADAAQGRRFCADVSSAPEIDAKADAWKTSAASGISIATTQKDVHPVGGIAFDNVRVVDAPAAGEESPLLFSFSDASAAGFGLKDLSGKIDFVNLWDPRKNSTLPMTFEALSALFPALTVRGVPIVDFTALSQSPEADAVTTELLDAWRERTHSSCLRVRGLADYWFYLAENEAATLVFQEAKVGRYEPNPVSFTCFSPDGTSESFTRGDSFEPFTVELKPGAVGWRRLHVKTGQNAVQLVEASCPAFAAASPSLSVFHTEGRFEFYVPKDAKDLGVRVVGSDVETVTARILDPDGVEVFSRVNLNELGAWTAPLDDADVPIPPKSGFWTIILEKPTVGCFEDFDIAIQGVPALLR